MKKKLSSSILGILLLVGILLGPTRLGAQESRGASDRTYTVGIGLSDRFIERNADGTYTGFEIELWEEIANYLGIHYVYKEFPAFGELLDALKQGKVDLGIWTITMNRERSDYALFSNTYFVSSLGIMTHEADPHSLRGVFRALFRPILGKTLLVFFGIIFFFGNILWFTELGSPSIISKKYFPGIFQSMWCVFAIQSTIGFGDIIPHRWVARLLAVPIWLCGLLLVAIITAQLLAAFTLDPFRSKIRDPLDLRGKTVATIAGTTSVKALDEIGVKDIVTTTQRLDSMFPKIESGEIDAIVFDYPYLADIANILRKQGKHPYLVPDHFKQQLYSIAVNKKLAESHPGFLEKINLKILELKENGYMEHLTEKWFGDIGIRQ